MAANAILLILSGEIGERLRGKDSKCLLNAALPPENGKCSLILVLLYSKMGLLLKYV